MKWRYNFQEFSDLVIGMLLSPFGFTMILVIVIGGIMMMKGPGRGK